MVDLLSSIGLGVGIFLLAYGYALRKEVAAFDSLRQARLPGSTGGITKQALTGKRLTTLERAKVWATAVAEDLTWLPRPLNLEQRLAWAGKLGIITAEQLRGEQLLYMLMMGLFGFIFGILLESNTLALVLIPLFGAAGIYAPIYLLDREGKKRQTEITITLPDAIDLISTSVAAGLGVDRAIAYTAQNITGPLGEELTKFLQEMQLGRSRQDAYQQLIWRNNSDEVQIIVGALLQGQSLGVPVTETLETQADTMRERRLQRAKEAGAKAAPRITMVMTLCIVPSIFLMFLAIVIFSIFADSGSIFSTLGG